MSIAKLIYRCLLQASTDSKYLNKWFGDDAWRRIFTEHFKLHRLTKQNINRTLWNTDLCLPLIFYKYKKQVKSPEGIATRAQFYYIATKEFTKDQKQLYDKLDWANIYYNY